MKIPFPAELEKWRIAGPKNEPYGFFKVPFQCYELKVQISAGQGWEHASVSRDRSGHCPTWEMMDFIKRLFWNDNEVVMQLHINDGNKVDRCHNCLHLWRPMTMDENLDERERWIKGGETPPSKWPTYPPIPLPPIGMV